MKRKLIPLLLFVSLMGIGGVVGASLLKPANRPALQAKVSLSASQALQNESYLQPGDWPQFRGPNSNGISNSKNPPLKWSSSENLRWTTKLPGPGSSSPIVLGNKVFVTCYSGYGDGSNGSKDNLLRHLICLNRKDGFILWEKKIKSAGPEDTFSGYITEHGYASSTPVTDGKAIYCFFGKAGVYTFDLEGRELWNAPVGTMSSNRRWGSASSPILVGDKLIVNASEEARALLALDKNTGRQLWKAEGAKLELCYGTPALFNNPQGRLELVLALPGEFWGINPNTGKLFWLAQSSLTGNVSPSVVMADDIAIGFGGFPRTGAVAIRAGGSGDVTSTHVIWETTKGSYVPCGVVHQGNIFWMDDRGLASCAETKTGALVFQERAGIEGGGGASRAVYASTVMAGGHFFSVTRKQGTVVWKASEKFEEVAINRFVNDPTDFNASPAIAGDQIFLRSNQAIYCVGN